MLISFTAISKYLSCPEEYNLYYNQKLRPEQMTSAFVFGGAIDKAFTTLVQTKKLNKAIETFDNSFINHPNIVYNENDLDGELITQEQYDEAPHYYSLKIKGNVILTTLYKEILPKIKHVYALQEKVVLKNELSEELPIIADLVCEWEDGSTILFDLKTSLKEYEKDSARTSQQLSLYYHFLKNKYSIDKIGFIVARKMMKKNRIKTCQDCGYDGSGHTHRTCPNKRNNGRCNGNWTVNISPEAYIQLIINKPNEKFINNMLDMVDNVGNNIRIKNYYKNLSSCKRGKMVCDYYKYCHENSMEGLIKKS